jgi:hypothetical protein
MDLKHNNSAPDQHCNQSTAAANGREERQIIVCSAPTKGKPSLTLCTFKEMSGK